MKKILSTVLIIVFSVTPLWAENQGSGPQDSVQQLLGEIRQIKPESSEENQKHSQVALSLLNVPEISRKALGKYWAKRSETEQEKFQDLLGELFIHVAFPSSAKFFAELDLVYGKTREKKAVVVVPLTVVHEKEGEVEIDFHLTQNEKKWKVVDVILDGVSMRNNLRSQFYKLIKKKDFNELLRKMNKKLVTAKS
ncbi:MAG: ABC transporter substrate-binding protein [Nitrospinae bacterium]|nr:ABC transporter substrate-binding protein [Nitrospinota bacterium]